MRAVAVQSPYGGTDKVRSINPDFFIDSISDLPGLLTKLEKEAS